jgi:hypothetical protein
LGEGSGQRSTTAIEAIARDVIRLGVSGRLPTTLQYQERLGIGSGTVQRTLRELRDEGAMSAVSKGHQGTFITAIDGPKLWRAAGLQPVHLLLPPYGPPESRRVARNLARQLAESGAAATVSFLPGAEARFAALTRGDADAAIMSAGAANDLFPQDGPYVALNAGPGSYYAHGSLVVVSRRGSKPGAKPRVGIDTTSDDHRRLTAAEFTGQVELMETNFARLPRAVIEGTIDVGIWHAVDLLIPLEAAGLEGRQLTKPEAIALATELSSAVVVACKDTEVGAVLGRIDLEALRATPPAATNGETWDGEIRLQLT